MKSISDKRLKALGGQMPRSSLAAGRGLKKGGKIRPNPKRKAANFARQYHSEDRVVFVQSLPCSACGVVGFSENAHVGRRSGMARKGPHSEIAPLCGFGSRFDNYPGCHRLYDENRVAFIAHYPAFDAAREMERTEELWQQHQRGEAA